MMSTLMFCTGPLGTYEAAFDLSGARYNILGSKLIIDTIEGNRFQWLKTVTYPPLPPVSRKERMYGRIIRQVHQIEKLRGYDTVEEKKAFVSSLLEKINDIMMRSSMTRAQNAAFVFLKKALLYYYDRIS
ncbi:hypothetical protein KBC03_03720 [Patescibacteria group bacterium]|nr:hypothetical protein [Patescibacteria group bacterium]